MQGLSAVLLRLDQFKSMKQKAVDQSPKSIALNEIKFKNLFASHNPKTQVVFFPLSYEIFSCLGKHRGLSMNWLDKGLEDFFKQLCGHSKFVLEATEFGFAYIETPQFLVSCFIPPVWCIWSTFEVYLTWLTDCWMRLFTTLMSVLAVVLCNLSRSISLVSCQRLFLGFALHIVCVA